MLVTKPLQDFNCIQLGIHYRKLMRKCELHGDWLSDSHTLLKGVNEFVPGLLIFLGQFI